MPRCQPECPDVQSAISSSAGCGVSSTTNSVAKRKDADMGVVDFVVLSKCSVDVIMLVQDPLYISYNSFFEVVLAHVGT